MKIKATVWKNTGNGQKLITIPAKSSINEGDIVYIEKLDWNQGKEIDSDIKKKISEVMKKEK